MRTNLQSCDGSDDLLELTQTVNIVTGSQDLLELNQTVSQVTGSLDLLKLKQTVSRVTGSMNFWICAQTDYTVMYFDVRFDCTIAMGHNWTRILLGRCSVINNAR